MPRGASILASSRPQQSTNACEARKQIPKCKEYKAIACGTNGFPPRRVLNCPSLQYQHAVAALQTLQLCRGNAINFPVTLVGKESTLLPAQCSTFSRLIKRGSFLQKPFESSTSTISRQTGKKTVDFGQLSSFRLWTFGRQPQGSNVHCTPY